MFSCTIAQNIPSGWAGTLHPDPATTPTPGPAAVVPNLHEYDWVVIRISGGKDSQAAMRETWRTVVALAAMPEAERVAWLEHAKRQIGIRHVKRLGKHRYLAATGTRLQRKRTLRGVDLEPLPYPKRPALAAA